MSPVPSRCRRNHISVRSCPECPSLISAIQRKTWKQRNGEAVWPPDVEAAFLEGLQSYRPNSTSNTKLLQRFPRRNRFIADYILKKTMKVRSAKQVGSRLQQLRDTCEDSRIRALISSKDWSDHEDVDTTQPQITTCSSPRGQSNQEQESAYPPSPIYPSSGDLQQYQSEDFSADTSPQETAPAASCVFVNGWSESQAPSAPIHSIPSREHNYVKSEGMFQPGMNVAGPVMDGTMYGHQFEDIHGRAEDMQQLSLSESVAYGYGQGSFDNVQHASYTVPTLFIDTSLLPSYTWSEPRTGESTLCSSESSQVASPWGSSAGSPASQSTLSDSDFAAMQAYTQYSPPFYPQDHSSSWSGLEAPEDGLDEALYPGYQTSTWESITWQSPQKV